MVDVQIDRLQIDIADASGHEHRVRPIAARAVEIFAARLEERWPERDVVMRDVTAAPVNVELNGMTDEEVAGAIAEAWLGAAALRLKV
jgi:hypothetical protein